jgi:hypothetical protein
MRKIYILSFFIILERDPNKNFGMDKKMVIKIIKIHYLINAPIITTFGIYEFRPYEREAERLDLSEAVSAIGHESTAQLLTRILGFPVKSNRIEVKMEVNEHALVYVLKSRISEGKILSFEELANLEYDLCILTRVQ